MGKDIGKVGSWVRLAGLIDGRVSVADCEVTK